MRALLVRRAAGFAGHVRALALLAAAGFATAMAAPVAPAAAQRSLVLEELHADLAVQPDGAVIIEERLRPRFTGSWNGVLRHLSLRHVTARGQTERLDAELLAATDGEGRPLRHEVNRIDGWTTEFRVWVPDATDRTATVLLRYRVRGAIRYFAADTAAAAAAAGDYDELYWQVTGTEWEVPILAASATVRLPPGAHALQASAYTGRASSTFQTGVELPAGRGEPAAGGGAAGSAVESAVRVPPVGPLDPGEGLTVAVGFTAGVVPEPAGARAPARPLAELQAAADGPGFQPGPIPPWAVLPLLAPFLVFWLAYRAWDRRGRDPEKRAVTVGWDAPALSPAEAGTLLDHSPDMHEIISTLVDLAVRGYVVIEEREKEGLFGSKDYAFHLVRPRSEWGDLARHERLFLDGLFEGVPAGDALRAVSERGGILGGIVRAFAGESASATAPENAIDSVLLSDLKNEFYKEIPGIKEALYDELVAKGHYRRRPDQVRTRWGLLTAGVLIAGVGLGVPSIASGTWPGAVLGVATIAAGVVSAIVLGVFTAIMPARTEEGARTRERVLGFRRFLERVESPRYRRMITSPDQFERFLPYAVAFQCADTWAKAFDDLLTEPPDWYHGRHGVFHPSAFAADLSGMARTASSTMASSPSSSGSGGGGSVGGGSGGGGGGGF